MQAFLVSDEKQTVKSDDQRWSVYKTESKSMSSMTVYTLSDTARQGEYVNFSIKVAEPINSVNVLVSCEKV